MDSKKDWDIYEVSMLIETYISVKKNEQTLSDALEKLSINLRIMASNQGYNVDDKYRNINGMHWQFNYIKAAFENNCFSRKPSKIFLKMKDIYINDRKKFDSILKQAHQFLNRSIKSNKKDRYAKWLHNQKIVNQTIEEHINELEKIFKRYIDVDIWSINSDEEYSKKVQQLVKKTGFKYEQKQEYLNFKRNYKEYSVFLKYIFQSNFDNKDITQKDGIENINENNEMLIENISKVLVNHFSNGIDTSRLIDMIRFKQYLNGYLNNSINLEEINLVDMVNNIGFQVGNKVLYFKENSLNQLKSIINSSFLSGNNVLYFEEIYNQNCEWLNSISIFDATMLKEIVEHIYVNSIRKKEVYIKNGFIANIKATELDLITQEIIRVWGEYPVKENISLKELLPFIPYEKIKYTLSCSNKFKRDSEGKYVYRNFFKYNDSDINSLRESIKMMCNLNGNVNLSNLDLNIFFDMNYEISPSAVYDFIFDILSDEFDRKANMIYLKGTCDDVESQIKQYCLSKGKCTTDELSNIMKNTIGRVDYWRVIEYASKYMVRIDEVNFVSDDSILYNINQIDCILDEIVRNGVIGLKEVVTFVRFPECGYVWNSFLLESYVRRFSDSYKYMSLSNNSKNVGAIVKKSINENYHEIMIKAIVKSSLVNLDRESIYDYLVDRGYLGRRYYKNIEELEMEVKKMRGVF